MEFWKEYLENPPHEVRFPTTTWTINPEDHHCVLWRRYEGEFDHEKL